MLEALSLRLRIFLFFLFLVLAGIGVVAAALAFGFARASGDLASAFVFSGIVAGFGLLALGAGIWLLFDENVAKPIERLAATLRTRAHAGVGVQVDESHARYLGDLGPAAQAVTGQLTESSAQTAQAIAAETAQLTFDTALLTELLTEVPVAIVLLSKSFQITLYDGQAAHILSQIHVPRLGASIFDYFQRDGFEDALAQAQTGDEVKSRVEATSEELTFDIRITALSQGKGFMLTIDQTIVADDLVARPLVYDFNLAQQPAVQKIEDTPVEALNFVVFDSETTGLDPIKDEVVQLGAVRVVNGKIVPGEVFDQLVNPGIAIPATSTKVHHISNAMVADAPDATHATRAFHQFAQGSVIVAHNAPFDMAFLNRYANDARVKWDHPILDTVLLSAVLFGASETHTLDALCARLGVTIPEEVRHSGLGDAQATAEVLCKMLPMLTSRGFSTFGEVVAQTRKHGRLLQDLN